MNNRNVMKIDGHDAVIFYDPDIDMLRGEFVGLNGGADFYATTIPRLKAEGARSLREFLAICKERDIDPNKKFSGTFNVRLDKQKHQALATMAAARGVSMNSLIDQAIDHELTVA